MNKYMGTKKFSISQQRQDCIGCGYCTVYSPNCWRMNKQDGKAELIGSIQKGNVVVAEVDVELLKENEKAASACPMQIIKINK